MKRLPALLAALAAFSALAASVALASPPRTTPMHDQLRVKVANPRTPIRHVVEIFQENVSFDHYFGTYPYAANSDGENFSPLPHTPAVDGLSPATSSSIPPSLRHSSNLLTSNPNHRCHAGSTATPSASPATPVASSPATRTTTTATSSNPSTVA